jgi:hypothetical protein
LSINWKKIKILVPLVQLAKNASYNKKIEKVIHGGGPTNPLDTLNVKYRCPTFVFELHVSTRFDPVTNKHVDRYYKDDIGKIRG